MRSTPSIYASVRSRRRAAARRRRALTLLLALGALLALGTRAWLDDNPSPRSVGGTARPAPLQVLAGRSTFTIPAADVLSDPALRSTIAQRLPTTIVASRSRARIVYRYDVVATALRVRSNRPGQTRIEAVRRPVAATITAPVIGQKLRNNCESAALAVLLATTGIRADQLSLQAQLSRSGPLDPRDGASGRIWGDPDHGFVGRPDGGGVAGGFGVYPGPVADLARRHGRTLDSLTGAPARRIYDRLLRGRAVMAWVGLSDGPYREWTSPQGRAIKVNLGEHTVVLVGMTRSGDLRVINPLEGTKETWSKEKFEEMWRLLGRRALGA